jgi:hypothetical protein
MGENWELAVLVFVLASFTLFAITPRRETLPEIEGDKAAWGILAAVTVAYCHLLCHYRYGLHLGLHISVVLSTICCFLWSGSWRDGFDFGFVRCHRSRCSLADRGQLADSPPDLRDCAMCPEYHRPEAPPSSVIASLAKHLDITHRQGSMSAIACLKQSLQLFGRTAISRLDSPCLECHNLDQCTQGLGSWASYWHLI